MPSAPTKTQDWESTDICGACDCVIRRRRLRLQCKGLCGRYFHIPCTDVPLELFHSVRKYPSFAWRCDDCSKKLPLFSPRHLNDYFVERLKKAVGEMEEKFNCYREEAIKSTLGKFKQVMSKRLAYEAKKKRKTMGLRDEGEEEKSEESEEVSLLGFCFGL